MHDTGPAPRRRNRNVRKTALLVLVAVSVMAMDPQCPGLEDFVGPGFVSTAAVVGLWAIHYDLLESTCSGDDPSAPPFVAKANVTTQLVGATHFLLWAFVDAPDSPIRGAFDVHTGKFEGETGRVPTTTTGVDANEMWSNVDIDANGTTHFVDGTSDVDFFFDGVKFCWRVFAIDGERIATASSARFKQDVRTLLPESVSILGLEPVTFRYLAPYGDPSTTRVGLIAEDVVETYSEAVVLDAEGRPWGIDYQTLTRSVIGDAGTRIGRALNERVAGLAGAR